MQRAKKWNKATKKTENPKATEEKKTIQKKPFQKKIVLRFCVVCMALFFLLRFLVPIDRSSTLFSLVARVLVHKLCVCVLVCCTKSYNLIETHIHKTNGPVQQLVYKGICAIACITRNLPKIVCIKIVVVMCCPIYKLSRPLVFDLVHMARFSSHSQSDFHRP